MKTRWQRLQPVAVGLAIAAPFNAAFFWPDWWLGVLSLTGAGLIMVGVDIFVYRKEE